MANLLSSFWVYATGMIGLLTLAGIMIQWGNNEVKALGWITGLFALLSLLNGARTGFIRGGGKPRSSKR